MENTTQPQDPQITLKDLHGLKVCVEVACQRGAYRADEMQAIGTVYNNLATFLKSVEPAAAQAEGAATETADEAPSAPQGE